MAGTPINWQLSCPRQWRKPFSGFGQPMIPTRIARTSDSMCVEYRNQFDRRQINWQRSVLPTACTVHRDCLGRELTYRSRQSCNFRITRGLRIRENFVQWRRTIVIELPSSRRKSCADRWRGSIVQFSVSDDGVAGISKYLCAYRILDYGYFDILNGIYRQYVDGILTMRIDYR